MAKTVIGLFDNFTQAQGAVRDLLDAGFAREDISVVAADRSGGSPPGGIPGAPTPDAAQGAVVGATTGAVIGGAAGLVASLGALAIPGFGPVLAAGPIVAMLSGAGIGAVAGGLIGALVNIGIPEEEARVYAEGVRRGGTLIAVGAADQRADRAAEILNRHNAVDVDERAAEYQLPVPGTAARGQPRGEPGASARPGARGPGRLAGEESPVRDAEVDFRAHHRTAIAPRGVGDYERVAPAYHYGYRLGTDTRFRDRDWESLCPQVQRRWEEKNPGTWSLHEEAVRYGWQKGRGR